MQGFASTREDRIATEFNIVANQAATELKPLRAKYLAMKAWSGKPPVPPIYYYRRMEVVLFDAANKLAAIEQHWTRRRT